MKKITLLYATSKLGKNKSTNKTADPTSKAREEHSNNKATILNNILNLQGEGVANSNMNIYVLQTLEMFFL